MSLKRTESEGRKQRDPSSDSRSRRRRRWSSDSRSSDSHGDVSDSVGDNETTDLHKLLSSTTHLLSSTTTYLINHANPGDSAQDQFNNMFELLKRYSTAASEMNKNIESAIPKRIHTELQTVTIQRHGLNYQILFNIIKNTIYVLFLLNYLINNPNLTTPKRFILMRLTDGLPKTPDVLNTAIVESVVKTKRFIEFYMELVEALLAFITDKDTTKLGTLFVKLQKELLTTFRALTSINRPIRSLPRNLDGFMSNSFHHHYRIYLCMIIQIGQHKSIRQFRDKVIRLLCNSAFVLPGANADVVANFISIITESNLTRDHILDHINDDYDLREALRFIFMFNEPITKIATEIHDCIHVNEPDNEPDNEPPSKKPRLSLSSREGGANKSKKVIRIYKKRNSTKRITRRQSNKKH